MKNDFKFFLSGKALFYLFISVILIAGCAGTDSRYRSLYSALTETDPFTAGRPLEGRRIVIDPGHGGRFKGVVGVDSISESEVNLGVALYLWGMLQEAGAEVYLTRTTDRDFITGGSGELKDDLQARMKKANSFHPEVFVSIHHNSTLPMNREKNGIEIFYRSADTGASLELAKYARLHLARNLGIEKSVIRPGNYFVLRHSKGIASILGEASYLSHPVVEDRLKLASKQKLEAEAYLLALLHYFSRGVPSLEMIKPETDTLQEPGELAFMVTPGFGVPLDPSSARIDIDGRERIPVFDTVTKTLWYGFSDNESNGRHTVRASISSVMGASTSSEIEVITLSRPPSHFVPLTPSVRREGGMTEVSLKILDSRGNHVIDGMIVTLSKTESSRNYTGKTFKGKAPFLIEENILPGDFLVKAGQSADTVSFAAPPADSDRFLRVTDSITCSPVPFPVLYRFDGNSPLRGDSKGMIRLDEPILKPGSIVAAAGFRPFAVERVSGTDSIPHLAGEVRMIPVLDGALINKKIVIDPGRGGDDSGLVGNSLTREASWNLDVAQKLRDFLVNAGARVKFTRRGEETISNRERISRTNRFDPTLAIGIHHDIIPGSGESLILHYPGSEGGMRVSRRLSESLGDIYGGGALPVSESAGLFLSQTSCPASEIHLESPSDQTESGFVHGQSYIYQVAERIFSSLARYFAGDRLKLEPARFQVTLGGYPLAGAVVSLDNNLTLYCDSAGEAVFSCSEKTPHLVTVQKGLDYYYCRLHDLKDEIGSTIVIELGNSQ